MTKIGTKLTKKRQKHLWLSHMREGEWIRQRFEVVKENLTLTQASTLAKKYRREGYLARRIKRSYFIPKSWIVLIADKRVRNPRKIDI